MKKIIYALVLFLCCGCSNFLEEFSQDLVTAKTVEDFNEVLLGSGYIPSKEISIISGNSNYCPWLNLLDDDINTTGARTNVNGFAVSMLRNLFGYVTWQQEVGKNIEGNYTADDNATWNNFYSRINVTNIILAEIDKTDFPQEADKLEVLRIKGECYFLRAQYYLTMVNLYANAYAPSSAANTLGVPLKLTGYVEQDNNKTSQFERTSVSEVYKQIVKDLQTAIDYLTRSPQKNITYRASKEAATLLLSRVYLYMQEWENAKKAAEDFLQMKDELIAIGQLATEKFLTENNPEVIFSQGSLNIQNTLTGQSGDFCISNDLYSLFDTMDFRQTVFFRPGPDSIAINKYRGGTHRSHVSDLFTLRVAEGYLNYAEACAMTDSPDDDAAGLQKLNQLRRNRIKDYVPQNYTGEQLVNEIRLERRKELCLEGHRWFDLRRYSVSEKYPYKKKIFRQYAYFTDQYIYINSRIFVLLEDDPAYTFKIPAKVIEFDKTMPNNPRNKREAYISYE